MRKKIMIAGIVVLMLLGMLGCSGKPTEENSNKNENDAEETKGIESGDGIKQLTLEQAFKKIDEKENFIFMVTQSTCSYCESFKKTLVPFLKEHSDIPFYEIGMDMIGEMKADTETYFKQLQNRIPEFDGGTPMTFCYENGKLKKSVSGELSEAALTNFMIDCGYIEGAKLEEKTREIVFKTSEKIKTETIIDVAEKIEKKETFYLMINEKDRFNQAFIEKLIPILKKKNITVTALQFPLEAKGSEEEMNKAYDTVMDCIRDLSVSPAIFEIKEGKAKKLMEDNVPDKEIEAAF